MDINHEKVELIKTHGVRSCSGNRNLWKFYKDGRQR